MTDLTLGGIKNCHMGARLENFHQLKTLKIDFDMLFGNNQHIGEVSETPDHPWTVSALNISLPPSLKSLTLFYPLNQDLTAKNTRSKILDWLVTEQSDTLPHLGELKLIEERCGDQIVEEGTEARNVDFDCTQGTLDGI